MKTIKTIVTLITIAVFYAATAFAGPSIVTVPSIANFGCGENQSGNTLNIGTPNANIAAGDILVLLMYIYPSTATINSITDRTGGTGINWHQVSGTHRCDTNGGCTAIRYGDNLSNQTNGAGFTINASSDATFVSACLMEVTGQNATTPIDSESGNDHTTAVTTLITPTIQGNSANELFLAMSACSQNGDTTAMEGGITFTPFNGPGAGDDGIGGCPAGYYYSSATGNYKAGLVQGTAGTGATAIFSIQ